MFPSPVLPYNSELRPLLSGLDVLVCCGLDAPRVGWTLPRFDVMDKSDVIDVWRLVDDGGLILLIPFMIGLHAFFAECRVRINVVVDGSKGSSDYEQATIARLIALFRLHFEDERGDQPSEATRRSFEERAGGKLSGAVRRKVLCRWLRLSKLLSEHSGESAMIIVTLPVPSKFITPPQYMKGCELKACRMANWRKSGSELKLYVSVVWCVFLAQQLARSRCIRFKGIQFHT